MKINTELATGAISGTAVGVSNAIGTINALLTTVGLIFSLIVSGYGLYRAYEDRKARRAAAKCDCPDKQ